MNAAIIATLIASASCGSPALDFKTFYRSYYYAASNGGHWAGANGESIDQINKRVLNAQGDWIEYRQQYLEKCK